jgi:hypothetical protein
MINLGLAFRAMRSNNDVGLVDCPAPVEPGALKVCSQRFRKDRHSDRNVGVGKVKVAPSGKVAANHYLNFD